MALKQQGLKDVNRKKRKLDEEIQAVNQQIENFNQ